MKKREKPEYTFSNSKSFLFYVGIFFVLIFFVIYLIIAIQTKKIDYISFFFNNIVHNLFYAILTSIHVSFLGIGILIMLTIFLQTNLTVKSYSDRFEIILFLQPKRVVYYNKIKSVSMEIFFYNEYSVLKDKSYKEARFTFNNPTFNFSLFYKVKGYFDNATTHDKERNPTFYIRKCDATKSEIESILTKLKRYCDVSNFYLPEEESN